MKSIKLAANAKINLHLDIEGKRQDGYHDIYSIMQSVDLCDTITLEYDENANRSISVSCNIADIPSDRRNIAYIAADKLLERGSLSIHIEKNIPSPAGLAGGSADAAAVLYGLKEMLDIHKTDGEMISICASVGADVPFCYVGGNMIVRGIGDILSDGEKNIDGYVVIAVMGDGVSTPYAYSVLDKRYGDFKMRNMQTCNAYSTIDAGTGELFNIFEDTVFCMRPQAMELKRIMTEHGGISLMSGSGPSVFGIYKSPSMAESAMHALSSIGAKAYLCRPTDRGVRVIE